MKNLISNFKKFVGMANNLVLVGGMNNISLAFPSFSLLTQREEIKENMFCDTENLPSHCKPNSLCYCTHRIKVKLDSIVELVLVDEVKVAGTLNHPFHLHGTHFYIMGMGNHPSGIPMTVQMAKDMDARRSLVRFQSSKIPPVKDTTSIPSKGYSIVRFKADNPGFWMLHCHYEWHLGKKVLNNLLTI
jgi:hypothetical protein